MTFRGVTAATGWIHEVLEHAIATLPEHTALGQAVVLHSEQNEVRLLLPSGAVYIITVRQE